MVEPSRLAQHLSFAATGPVWADSICQGRPRRRPLAAGLPTNLVSGRDTDLSSILATIVLVSCVSKKQSSPCAAADLYLSPWFCKARRYAEAVGDRWFILSAEYGLLAPLDMIAPYERTLNAMSKSQRQAWATDVLSTLRRHLRSGDNVSILAGGRYREFLEGPLRSEGFEVLVPLEGLAIGLQLQRLGDLVGSGTKDA